jgi:hypothetical protein
MISNGFKFAIAYVLLCGTVVKADGFVTFSDWSTTPQTVGNLTLSLTDWSDAFNTVGQVSIFTNSSGNEQLNTWPTNFFFLVSDGDFFEYTVEADPGYFVDWAAMSYNPSAAGMTTTVTVDSTAYVLQSSRGGASKTPLPPHPTGRADFPHPADQRHFVGRHTQAQWSPRSIFNPR